MDQRIEKGSSGWRFIAIGLLFAICWASASTVTKIGLTVAQPLVISVVRFFMAGVLMLFISHGMLRERLPRGKEWGKIAVYGLLNISLYLGIYVYAMQQVSPGLGSLAVAINPVIIMVVAAAWDRKALSGRTVLSLLLCVAGVTIAAYPLVQGAYATTAGILILFSSMFVYSAGTLYFQRNSWEGLHLLTINGWQTLLGGVFILPVVVLTWRPEANQFNGSFWFTTIWLATVVSILAVQCWIYMLKHHGTRSSYWLFLCPIFGFIISNIVVDEPLGLHTLFGLLFVIGGLYWVLQRK
ncbi:MAG: EamA family transporter [Chitinophagia bacterium]|nr:EamA family transporter [Chitinophagia bacterium]